MFTKRSVAPLALAFACALAQAQAIYRCGDSYGSQPCAGGREIAPDPVAPSAAERRQAGAAAQRDARLAEGLERQRVKEESRPADAYIPPPPAEPVHAPHKWPEKAATRKLDVFTATGPAPAGKDKDAAKKGKPKARDSAAKTPPGEAAPKSKSKASPAGDDKKQPQPSSPGRMAAPAAR
jgi:hypothetical protein